MYALCVPSPRPRARSNHSQKNKIFWNTADTFPRGIRARNSRKFCNLQLSRSGAMPQRATNKSLQTAWIRPLPKDPPEKGQKWFSFRCDNGTIRNQPDFSPFLIFPAWYSVQKHHENFAIYNSADLGRRLGGPLINLYRWPGSDLSRRARRKRAKNGFCSGATMEPLGVNHIFVLFHLGGAPAGNFLFCPFASAWAGRCCRLKCKRS